MIAHCVFQGKEPDILAEIVFVFRFTQDETGAPKVTSTVELMDSLAVVTGEGRGAPGKREKAQDSLQYTTIATTVRNTWFLCINVPAVRGYTIPPVRIGE